MMIQPTVIGEQGQHRLHRDVLVEVARLAVDLVPPDEVVDAQREEGPDEPGQPDVPGLARAPGHAPAPSVPCRVPVRARPACRARPAMASPRTSKCSRSDVDDLRVSLFVIVRFPVGASRAGGAAGQRSRQVVLPRESFAHVVPGRRRSSGGRAAPPSSAGEPGDLVRQARGGQRGHAVAELAGQRRVLGEGQALERRLPVAAQAGLGQRGELTGQRLRRARAPPRPGPPG